MRRCKQCEDEKIEKPSGPVKIIKVVARDADNIPTEFREYALESETAGIARKKRAGLG